MAFTVTLADAASQYGFGDQSLALGAALEPIIGVPTGESTSWGSGQLAVGQSGSVTFSYSKGFSLALSFTKTSATAATVTEAAVVSPQGTKLLDYVGQLGVTSSALTGSLSDSIALSGADTIHGNSANNVLEGYAGNDTIDGGGGTDYVRETGARASYGVSNNAGTITVSGPDGTDTLVNVERILFDDAALAFDVNGEAGQVYRLYQAALNRAPDQGGLGFYINILDGGWHLHDIAGNFIASPEFLQRFGSTSDLQFVQLLYQNVLHRAGEDSGVQFHLNELAIGLDRAQLLINFSESPENQANLLGAMNQGMLYTVGG